MFRIETPAAVQVPEEMLILPSGSSVIFPSVLVPLSTADAGTIKLIEEALSGNGIIGVFAERPNSGKQPPASMYPLGCAALVSDALATPQGLQCLLHGLARMEVTAIIQFDPYLRGRVQVIASTTNQDAETAALAAGMAGAFRKTVLDSPELPDELGAVVGKIDDPGMMADFVAAHLPLSLEQKQEMLETVDVPRRIKRLVEIINLRSPGCPESAG